MTHLKGWRDDSMIKSTFLEEVLGSSPSTHTVACCHPQIQFSCCRLASEGTRHTLVVHTLVVHILTKRSTPSVKTSFSFNRDKVESGFSTGRAEAGGFEFKAHLGYIIISSRSSWDIYISVSENKSEFSISKWVSLWYRKGHALQSKHFCGQ